VLWQSDGSTDGTRILIGDVFPVWDPYSSQRALAFAGKLLLAAQTTATDCGLATVDPEGGTISMLRRFTSYASGGVYCPDQLVSFAGRAFFVAAEDPASSQPLLWTTDATPEGTRPFLDERGAPLQTGSVAATPTHLFFTAYRSAGGNTQLWRTDRSPGGTTLVVTLPRYSPEYVSNPSEMVTAGETLFFTWSDAEHGTELWKSDGTTEGTSVVRDIRPGALGSIPKSLTAAGRRLYFVASDGVHGMELWTSDGTETGTMMVQDIAPGAASSNPADLTATCESLFFSADDGQIGREPWVLPIPADTGSLSPCHRAVTGPVTGTPVRRRGAPAASRTEAAE
jgi:ELWxxDGT repeat protein